MCSLKFNNEEFHNKKQNDKKNSFLVDLVIKISKGKISNKDEAIEVLFFAFVFFTVCSLAVVFLSTDKMDENELPPRNELKTNT